MNWFSTFSELCSPRCCVCKWNLCHEIAFSVCGCVPTWIKFTQTLSPLTFSHTVFVLFTIFVFASLFYLLTLYNILLLFSASSSIFSISLRPIICSYETKLNFFFFIFFFSSGLEDCCCLVLLFSFFAPCCAMCTCDVMRLRKWVWVRAWAIASLSRACFDGNGLFLSASAPAWLCVSESLMGDF